MTKNVYKNHLRCLDQAVASDKRSQTKRWPAIREVSYSASQKRPEPWRKRRHQTRRIGTLCWGVVILSMWPARQPQTPGLVMKWKVKQTLPIRHSQQWKAIGKPSRWRKPPDYWPRDKTASWGCHNSRHGMRDSHAAVIHTWCFIYPGLHWSYYEES